MSLVKIQGNASGTGIFTVAAPATNTDRTLTLPDQTGTILTNVGPFTANASASAGAVTVDASNNVGIGTSSPGYKLTVSSGTTNATTYTPVSTIGGSTLYLQQQQTTSVSTSAVVILTPGLYGSLCLVHGSDGTNRFQDLVMFGLGTGTVNVINSMSIAGTPASRTYSQSSSTYRVAMGSGTYTVQVAALSMSS